MTLKGISGAQEIQNMLEKMRNNPPKTLGEYKVLSVRDYQKEEILDVQTSKTSPTGLPVSNVLYYDLEDGAWCCVRPSGTEPKIKFYFGVKGTSFEDANNKLEALTKAMLDYAK